MNMLSSHRIAPSIVSGYDHVLDQSSLKSSSHLMISERTNLSNDRSNMVIERPSILGDRMAYSNDRSSYERSSFVSDRPSYASDRSSYLHDRSRIQIDSNRPNVLEELKNSVTERSNITSDRINSYERPSVLNERQDIVGERFVHNGHKIPDGHRYSPNNRHISPECQSDRTNERPILPTNHSSIEHPPRDRSPLTDRHDRKSKSPHNPLVMSERQTIHQTSYCKTSIFRGEMFQGLHKSSMHSDNREYNDRFDESRIKKARVEEPRVDDEDNAGILTRTIPEKTFSNHLRPYLDHPTTKHNISATLPENNSKIFSTHVSSSASHLNTVPTITHNNVEDGYRPKSHSPRIHTSEPSDKGKWKNYDFIDKSGDYLHPVNKSSVDESYEKHKQRMSVSPLSNPGQSDNFPPIYRSPSREKISKSPSGYLHADVNDNYLDIPRHAVEKSQVFDRKTERISSRSPSNVYHDNSKTHEKSIFATKETYFHNTSPERHGHDEHSVTMHKYSSTDRDLSIPLPRDRNIISPQDQTFLYNKSPLRSGRPHMYPEDIATVIPRRNSPPIHSTDKNHSPVHIIPNNSIDPPIGVNFDSHRSRSPLVRPTSNPRFSPQFLERSHVVHENVSAERETYNDVETVRVEPAEAIVNGHSPLDDHSNDSTHHAETSTGSKSDVDSAPTYNELDDEVEENNERMTSPVPPVVILNTEDVNEDDDDGDVDADGDMGYDEPNEMNEMDMDEDISDSNDVPHRDLPMLSSERPSMLSDSPSMVSALNVRPSMVGDSSNENGAMDGPLNSSSDKPNVVKRGKRKKYQKYTPADRIAIGKFCFEHGPAAARKAFQSRYPEMSESVTRGFRDKYKLLIGEYAVYCYEQKRRKEMHARTESLPRGRPRKYKQIENGDKSPLPPPPTTTLPPTQVPPVSTAPPPPSSELNKPKVIEHTSRENGVHEDKSKTYTREEKLLIGWFCAKHGADVALKVFTEEHPDLTMEMVATFHKMYIESEGQISENDKADVFVVDTENNSLHSPPLSMTHDDTSKSETNSHSPGSPPHESSETRIATETRHSPNRDINLTQPENIRLSSSDQNRSPVSSSPRPVSTISPHSMAPIIHYPKVSPDNTPRDHRPLEPRELKHEYNLKTEMNGETMGYPYDRQMFMYNDDTMANGTSSLPRTKRFKYQKYSPEDRYNIGKLCNDIGLGATVKVYREQFPRLNESVVRTFRNKYRELLQKGNGVPMAEAIQRKPSRRSITTVIESEVVSQLKQFKQSNIEINEKLVVAIAENVIATKDQKDIGPVKNTVTPEWASSLLWKHKLVERQVSNPNGVCCERCKTPLICPKC